MHTAALHKVVEQAKHATLYVVATPIGNLRDITLRALDILKSVDVVVAEDTRVCSKLLGHFGISARVIASHEHNERESSAGVVKLLSEGKSVALTTDAGTPAVSDPGALMVAAARNAGFTVVAIPGPSALATALSVAGLQSARVLFCGFLPAKGSERREALDRLAGIDALQVLYESPHRVIRTIDDLISIHGGQVRVTICREMTKLYEEVRAFSLEKAKAWLENNPEHVRGEFVLLVQPVQSGDDGGIAEAERVLALLITELPLKKAVTLTVAITGARKNVIYQKALEIARDNGDA